jgi:general secretion pathway protein M
LGFAFFQLIAAPILRGYPEAARKIENSQTLLRRYRALSAQGPELSARLQATQDAVSGSITYLDGNSQTLAGAELQNLMRGIVEIAGGGLRSSQILPVESSQRKEAITRVGLRVQAWVGAGHLQDLLYGVETAEPSIFIHTITITEGKSGELGADVETNPMVEVTVEVYGFRGEEPTRSLEDSATQIQISRSAKWTDRHSLTVRRDDGGSKSGIK